MRESDYIFQKISLRRRVIIAIGMLTVLIVVIGFYGLVAIVESNQRLHKSVIEGQTMAETIDTARLSQVHFKKQVQEWKNILLRGNDKDLFNKHLKAFNEEEQKVSGYLQSLSRLTTSAGLSIPQITDAMHVHEKLGRQYREALAKYKQHDLASAVLVDKSVRGIDRNLTDQIDAIVGIIKNLTEKRMKETETIAQTQMEAYHALSFFIIFLIVAGVFFGIYNTWSITKELSSGRKSKQS
jgi:methyl-accepting chemotaxis protein